MQRQFMVIVERDPESGWLVGSVPELPGCYTQEPDMASLEANILEAVEVFLATVEEKSSMTGLIFVPAGCQCCPTLVWANRANASPASSWSF